MRVLLSRADLRPRGLRSCRTVAVALLLVGAARPLLAQDARQPTERVHARPHTEWALRGQRAIRTTLAQLAAAHQAALAAQRAGRPQPARAATFVGPQDTVQGTFTQAVIPIAFGPDTVQGIAAESLSFPVAAIQARLYGAGTTSEYSLTRYYQEVSYGRLTLTGSVVAPVTLPHPRRTYVGSGTGYGQTADSLPQLVLGAIAAADQATDFAPLADPVDHHVAAVVLVHAGLDGVCDATSPWPHRWTVSALREAAGLGTGPYVTNDTLADGQPVVIDDYILVGEQDCNHNLLHVGLIGHETGHLLGLPDLYETNAGGSPGPVGDWDLMATGEYVPESWPVMSSPVPIRLSAWSRAFLGWSALATIDSLAPTDSFALTLPSAQRSAAITALRLPNSTRYVLLETRTKEGADTYLPGQGVLVWYVDPAVVGDTTILAANTVERPERPGIALLAADGWTGWSAGSYGGPGNAFPGSNNVTSFDSHSDVPFTDPNTGLPTGLAFSQITLANGTGTLLATWASDSTPVDSTGSTVAIRPNVDTLRMVATRPVTLRFWLDSATHDASDSVHWTADPSDVLRTLGLTLETSGDTLTLSGTVRATAALDALTLHATTATGATGSRTYPVRIHPPLVSTVPAIIAALLDPAGHPLPSGDLELLDAWYGNHNGRFDLVEFVTAARLRLFSVTAADAARLPRGLVPLSLITPAP